MNFSEAISFSLQALKANRLRTFLTALGLIIGNASVILVVTISLASKDLILDQIRGVGFKPGLRLLPGGRAEHRKDSSRLR